MRKRLIMRYIFEIVLCFVIIISSIYLWQNNDLTYYGDIAKGYASYSTMDK